MRARRFRCRARTDEDYVQRYDCVLHPEASHLRRIEWEEHPALGWQFLAEHEALCLFFGRAGNLHIERVHLRAGLDGELYGFGLMFCLCGIAGRWFCGVASGDEEDQGTQDNTHVNEPFSSSPMVLSGAWRMGKDMIAVNPIPDRKSTRMNSSH